MSNDFRGFEQAFGREVPYTLKALFDNLELLAGAPLRIVLPGKPFVVEIQYFLGITDLRAEDLACQRFAFAVNSDGCDMLVDLNGPDLPVLQREAGEVDQLDFTLAEFLTSAKRSTAG